jgi:hypothetical protein
MVTKGTNPVPIIKTDTMNIPSKNDDMPVSNSIQLSAFQAF